MIKNTKKTQSDDEELQSLRIRIRKLEEELRKNEKEIEKLRNQEGMYRGIVDGIPDLIYVVGSDMRVRLVNPAAAMLFGARPEEVKGTRLSELFPPETARQYSSTLKEIIRTGNSFSSESLLSKEHESIWTDVVLSPLKDDKGTVSAVVGVSRDISNRKRIQEQLYLFKQYAESSSQGFGIADMEGYVFYVNPALLDMLEAKSIDDVLNLKFSSVYPEDMKKKIRAEVLPELMETGRWEGELVLHSLNGKPIPTHESYFLIRDEQGKPVYMADILIDITERKAREEELLKYRNHLEELVLSRTQELENTIRALNKSDETAHTLLNAPDETAALLDTHGIILKINDTGAKRFGKTADEMVGINVYDLLPPDLKKSRKARIDAVIETGKPAIFEDSRGGICFENRVFPVRDRDDNSVIGVAVYAEDITQHKQMEKELEYQTSFAESLMDSLPGVMYAISPQGRFVRWNKSFELVSGYTSKEMEEIGPLDLFEGKDKLHIAERITSVFETGKADAEAHLVAKDGTRTPHYFTGCLATINNEPCLVGMGIDVSRLKRIEDELRVTMGELERSNRELEQFAYVASHDLQEPLRMVTSYVQLLAKRYGDRLDRDATEFIHFAVDGAERMKALIDSLLQYSRVHTRGGNFIRTRSSECVEKAMANLSIIIDETEATVTFNDLPEVAADPVQLVQLIQNLISNAIRFRREDPPYIGISAVPVREEDLVDAFPNTRTEISSGWQFSVSDNGIGISEQFFDRIFTIFQRLHGRDEYPGTGIGLAICKRIVERHGGRLWIESTGDSGSTFHFTIPGV